MSQLQIVLDQIETIKEYFATRAYPNTDFVTQTARYQISLPSSKQEVEKVTPPKPESAPAAATKFDTTQENFMHGMSFFENFTPDEAKILKEQTINLLEEEKSGVFFTGGRQERKHK